MIFGRKKHVKAVQDAYGVAHVWMDRYNALSRDSREYSAAVEEDRIEKDSKIADLTTQRDVLQVIVTQIRAVIEDVPVYEGMNVGEALVPYVSELARDHTELEARIDAVLFLLSGLAQNGEMTLTETEIARLLKGGERFP